MPADGRQLLRYFRHLRDRKLTPATCDAYLSAVCAIHRINGHAVDRSALVAPMKAYLRKNRSQKRAAPLLGKILRDLVARLDPASHGMCATRHLLLLFSAALRSSEGVGLDLNRIGPRHLGATRRRSSTTTRPWWNWRPPRTTNSPPRRSSSSGEMPSLRTWLDRWLALAGVQEGEAVFRASSAPVLPRRLAAATVLDIRRRRMLKFALATGKRSIDAVAYAKAFSGTAPTGVLHRRFPQARPARPNPPLSRHRSDEMLGRYIASAELRRSSGSRGWASMHDPTLDVRLAEHPGSPGLLRRGPAGRHRGCTSAHPAASLLSGPATPPLRHRPHPLDGLRRRRAAWPHRAPGGRWAGPAAAAPPGGRVRSVQRGWGHTTRNGDVSTLTSKEEAYAQARAEGKGPSAPTGRAPTPAA